MIIQEDMEYIYEMAKLIQPLADKNLGDFGKFIYFSANNGQHGPRVKFYGGTRETETTRSAPTMKFDTNGNTSVEIAEWMTKKNCPNAYNKSYLQKIHDFINKTLPILLLVWFYKLDEGWALEYFQGRITLQDLLVHCEDVENDVYNELVKINSINELHKFCKKNNLYR